MYTLQHLKTISFNNINCENMQQPVEDVLTDK